MTDFAALTTFFSGNPLVFAVFLLLAVWSLIWKGFALWKAARLGQRNWFIAILIVNSIGILEIIYIYWFSRKQRETQYT